MNDRLTPLMTIGVVADTHVPDRVSNLHPELLENLRNHQVDMILHAGDICSPKVIDELSQIAPVTAVCGNRDWLFRVGYPSVRRLTLAGVDVALLHGHGNWMHYVIDKIVYLFRGYHFARYREYLMKRYYEARIVIFGHTHRAVSREVEGVLIFNPGSSGCTFRKKPPSMGIIRIYSERQIESEIIPMEKGRIRGRQWVVA